VKAIDHERTEAHLSDQRPDDLFPIELLGVAPAPDERIHLEALGQGLTLARGRGR
jgi:hypothetical protein